MKKLLLLTFISLSYFHAFSQNEEVEATKEKEQKKIFFGVKAGISDLNSSYREYAFIRQTSNYYNGYRQNTQISLSGKSSYVAIVAEYRTKSDKFWFSSGILYSYLKSQMAGSEFNSNAYFLVSLDQDSKETSFYSVNQVTQVNQYIGLPIEIRYALSRHHLFRPYIKLGFDFNFRIATKRNIKFNKDGMSRYESQVIDLFDQPKNFYAGSAIGVGLQIGKQQKPNFRIEAELPFIVLTPNAFGLMNHHAGLGLEVSFVLPFGIK